MAPLTEARIRDVSLDYLRAVAAGVVALNHGLEFVYPTYYLWEERWLSPGRIGVVVFFLISGHLFADCKLQGLSRRNFARKRLLRIFPTYLAALVVFTIAPLGLGPHDAKTVVANVFLVQSFAGYHSIVPPAWTLPIELSFYTLVWIAIPAGQRYFRITFWIVVFLTVTVTSASIVLGAAFPTTVLLLVAAAFLGGVRRNSLESKRVGAIAMPTVVFALLTLYVAVGQVLTQSGPGFHWSIVGYFGSTMLGLIVFFLGQDSTSRVVPMAMWVGEVSYSMYLIHPVGYLLLGKAALPPVFTILLYFPATIGLSALLFYLVERPSLKLARQRRRGYVHAAAG